jgi:formylglycine-generating enzyme required for sulfatase activity
MTQASGADPRALPATLSAPGLSGAQPAASSNRDDGTNTVALPESFHEYRVLRPLGTGAMGQVYLAHDVELDRLVAIKALATPSPAHCELMRIEAQAAAAIQHPNVVTIYRVGTLEGRPYIVTEYIRGASLDGVPKPVPWQRALAIGIDLARGLAAAHRHDVLHRDIKPANAILSESGQAKLIDFGLAVRAGRAPTGENGLVGTPSYMAPELWQGEPASQPTDIYALGVLLYELCTGRLPRPASSVREIERLEDVVPGIDARFAELVHRCLAVAPGERHASGDVLRDALEALREIDRPHPLPAGNPYRGLLPFDVAHRALFFGRNAEVRLVIERMCTQRFVLLAGESGVGKSSLARAGVLPAIAEGALRDERTWTTWTQVPGQRPLTTLLHALATRLGADEDALLQDVEQGDFAAVSGRLRRQQGAGAGLVLFLDQLEELDTLADRHEAERTAALLASLAERTPGVRILATARGDYLAPLAALPGLGPLIERSLCIIRPLQAEAIRDVIVAPARAHGVRFESDALVERLVTAATRTGSALPLLQFALAQLWEQRDVRAGVIREADFDAIGGVEGALARHATGVLNALLPETRRAMQHILVRMVTSSGTRARLTAGELCIDDDDARRNALDALVAGRLVVAGELDGEPVYEIAHEALISGWPKLRAWLDRASSIRVVQERLTAAAREWERASRAREYLWGPRQLAAAEAIDSAGLPAAEKEFLAASTRAIRRDRWQRRLAVAAVLALLAGAYGVYRLEVERELGKHLDAARLAMDDVRGRWRVLEAEHRHAMRALESDQLAEAGARWRRVLNLAPEVDAAFWQASRPLELALSLDPQRQGTRALMGALLDEHARLADIMGHRLEHEQLVERLSLYDAAAHARWSAPVAVTVDARPGTAVTIERYVARPDGSMVLQAWADGRARATPQKVALPPGSYMLRFAADAGHAEVRYPLVVHPATPPAALDIVRPPHAAVPPGFVYVPPGRFVSGFGRNADDEPLRKFYEAEPQHERWSDGFLIARHEITFEEWMEYLDACWPAGCDGVVPSVLETSPDDASMVAVTLQPHREHGWEIVISPTKGSTYRAVRGELLVYQGRQKRRAQRWERFPVGGVSRVDVDHYLRWLRATGRVPGARLCTAKEWERAARGADSRMFPHGNRLQPDDANFDLTYDQAPHAFGPDEVGAHPLSASPFGLHDMIGNVWELVAITIEPVDAAGGAGRDHGGGARLVHVRGGSFFQAADVNNVVNEWVFMSEQKGSTVGFRVCADAPRM